MVTKINEEVFDNEIIRNRIMQLEYGELTVWEIKQIYLEETGKELPSSIEVFHSKDYIDPAAANGFDGTIIHIYDEKKGINQTYTITRGSEHAEEDGWRPSDWIYNVMGIFVGKDASQYRAAVKFDQRVSSEIESEHNNTKLKKIGLGHSLGGNLITLLQIVTGTFDSVYATNPAPPSVYQLVEIDRHFLTAVDKNFGLDPKKPNAIYQINPDELKTFAEDYYKQAGQNINITIAEQDILYAISNVRGFFSVGNRNFINAYPDKDIESLKPLFDKLPDDVLQAIQVYLATNLSQVYNEEGFDGFLRELTGVNGQLIDDILTYEGFDYVKNIPYLIKEGSAMIKDMKEKVPIVLGHIKALRDNIEPILDTFVSLDYMTQMEKETVISEIDGLESDLEELTTLIRNAFKLDLNSFNRIKNLFSDIDSILNRMSGRVDRIFENTEVLRSLIQYGGDAHGLARVVNALGGKNRHFENGDLIITRSHGGELISVNVSSATRIFLTGSAYIDAKAKILEHMRENYEVEYLEHYKDRKSTLLQEIHDMESFPSKYQYLLGNFTYDTQLYYRLTKINVHEDIPPLPYNGFQAVFDNMFVYIESDIEKQRKFLADVRESIEKLFEVEEGIAQTNFRLGAL